jgi:phage terminase large subunit
MSALFDLEKELRPFDPVNDPKTRAEVLARPNPFTCLDPNGEVMRNHRVITIHGGRGSGKTFSVADWLRRMMSVVKANMLCAREFQNSIEQSTKQEIESAIDRANRMAEFKITRDKIVHKRSKSAAIFKGLHNNVNSLKSISNILVAWLEEGQTNTKDTLEKLLPSIRMPDNRIIITMNPEDSDAFIYTEMVEKAGKEGYKDRFQIQVNYYDNPYFTESLESDRQNSLQRIIDAPNEEARLQAEADYAWIWLGFTKRIVGATVIKRTEMREFEAPANVEFYHGADWSNGGADPTAFIRCFIAKNERDKPCLWIDYEAYNHNAKLDDLPSLAETIPTLNREGARNRQVKWRIRADSSLPVAINTMLDNEFDCEAAVKGPGSVENGLQFLNNFDRIYIHPRCYYALEEAKKYRWKTDRMSGRILPILEKGNDHVFDAVRYALEHLAVNVESLSFFDIVNEKSEYAWDNLAKIFIPLMPAWKTGGSDWLDYL